MLQIRNIFIKICTLSSDRYALIKLLGFSNYEVRNNQDGKGKLIDQV